jgi:hypothetical protein
LLKIDGMEASKSNLSFFFCIPILFWNGN